MKVERLVNSIFNSNSYLLSHEESTEVWVVDPGDWEPIVQRIGSRTLTGVLLTHAHFDHIYGLDKLTQLFPNVVVYTSSWGEKGLRCEKLNGSRYTDQSFTVAHDKVVVVADGDTIQLWDGIAVQVVETPGHNADCLSYYLSQGYIFTGDALIPSIKVVAKGKYSDKEQVPVSIHKILARCSPDDVVCPGHNARCAIRNCEIIDLPVNEYKK